MSHLFSFVSPPGFLWPLLNTQISAGLSPNSLPIPYPPQPQPASFLQPQVSKISLVDLAGSERADSSGARGMRLKVRDRGMDGSLGDDGGREGADHPQSLAGRDLIDRKAPIPHSLSFPRKAPTSINP